MLKKYYHIVENSSSLFLLKVIDLALIIWLIPFLIAKVGLINYGIYAFYMALMLFFVNVLNYCFNLTTVREVAKYKNEESKINAIFSEVISAKLVLGFFLYLIVALLLFIIPSFREQKELYIASSLLIISNFFSIQWFFYGIEKMKFITIINFFSKLTYVLLVFKFVNFEEDYKWIPLYESIGLFLVSLISFFIVVKKFNVNFKLQKFSDTLVFLRENFNSFLNLLLPSTYGTFIVFFVGIFGLPIHVSLMEIGVKLTGAFSTINNIMTKVFYPIVNRKVSFRYSARIILLGLGGVLSFAMYFSGEFLLKHWLHLEDEYHFESASVIVQILSPIPILMSFISAFGVNGLLTLYKDVLFSKITVASFVVMIVTGILVFPYSLLYGGAISFLAGRVVHALLSYYFFRKRISHNE